MLDTVDVVAFYSLPYSQEAGVFAPLGLAILARSFDGR